MKNSKSSSSRKTPISNHKESNNCGSKEQICDICAQNVPGPEREKIFAFGKCDHHVCYVCSARLRVVCDQSDCPICREKLDSVIFSSNKNQSYERYNLKDCLYNEKYKIYFENKTTKDAFDKLLKYECQECLRTKRPAAKPTAKKGGTNNKLTKDERQKSSPPLDSCGCSNSSREKQLKQAPMEGCSATGLHADSGRDNVPIQSGSTTATNCKHKDEKKTQRGESSSSAIESRIEDDSQGLLRLSDVSSHVFPDVLGLKNHLRYMHRLKLCDLCLTHNKLFPFEFSYYDDAALKKHTKEGEPKTSHRGHPKCVLCSQTFFNTDELIQHMSREHFHCHLCGRQDSNMRIYFLDYDSLREHFKAKHFLCERDHCRHEQFTSAFDSRLDLQVHLVEVHGNATSGLSRGEARQQRTITLDSAPHRARAISPGRSMSRDLPPNAAIVSTGNMATANNSRQQRPESIHTSLQIRSQRLPTRSEFPALGHSSTYSGFNNSPLPSFTQTPPNSDTNHYPSLAQTTNSSSSSSSRAIMPSTLSQRLVAGPSSSRGSFVRTAGGGFRHPEQLNEMDFPPLPEQPKKAKASKKSRTQNSGLQTTTDNGGPLTLDQLIQTSLTLAARNNRFNGKKAGSKGNSAKSNKSVKQKAVKIQL